MKKIGRLFIFLVCLIASLFATAQINFTAKGPSVVGVNEGFTVSYTVNSQNVKNFQNPSISGAQLLAGPYTSRSSNTTIINGKVSSSSSVTFTFTLMAPQAGTITLSPAKITADGKTYSSNVLKIQASNNYNAAQNNNNQRQQQNNPFSQYYNQQQNSRNQTAQQTTPPVQSNNDQIDNDVMFVRAIPNKTNVVKGEEIVITYKLYTRVRVTEYAIDRIPSSSGFWIEEPDGQSNPTISEEVYNGKRYQVANLKKVIVYPQKSGTLTIKPMSLSLTAIITSRSRQQFSTGDPFMDQFLNDPFFSTFSMSNKAVQKKLFTNSITFNVKDIPQKPDNYCGGVGNFSLESEVSSKHTKAFEAFYLTYKLKGNGNLTLINNLPLDLPDEFQISDPEITDNINRTSNGLTGERTFRYLVIPRIEGTFKIPDLSVSYYNINKNAIDSLMVSGYEIKVDKGDISEDFAQQLDNRARFRNMDIKSNLHFSKTTKEYHIFDSGMIYLIPVLCILILAISIALYSRYKKLSADIVTVKMKKSTKIAVKRLKKAKKYLDKGQTEAFEDETAVALWNYLEDRFKMDRTNLSIQGCKDELLSLDVAYETVDKLGTILERCQYLRFSQDKEASADMTLYNDTVEVISSIEEQMKTLKKVKKTNVKTPEHVIHIPDGLGLIAFIIFSSAISVFCSAQNVLQNNNIAQQKNTVSKQQNLPHKQTEVNAEQLCKTAESYFKQSDYANAMLYYEKALKLSPADKNIQLNINIVRSRLVGDTYIIPEFVLTRWVKHLSGLLPLIVWFILFTALFVITCVMFFLYLFSSDKKVLLFYITLFALIFSLVSLGLGIVRQNIQNDTSNAILMKSNIHLRQNKNMTGKDVLIMYKGQKIKILEDNDEKWLKVRTEDHKQGYMENKNYKRI